MVNKPFDTVAQAETLEEKCLRVCKTIVECGIAIRGGKIAPGGNNVLANNAAMHVLKDEDAMSRLRVNSYRPFAEIRKLIISYRDGRLEDAARAAVNLKNCSQRGRIGVFNAKPLNWDINAAGVKMFGYVEPTGVAKNFVEAFGIGYQNPALRSRQIGDGSSLIPR